MPTGMTDPTTKTRPTSEDDIALALAAPFHPNAVEWRVGTVAKPKKDGDPPSRAMALAYVDARAVRKRLNKVLGIGGWKSRHYDLGGHQIACEISLKLNGEWIGKTDGGWVGNIHTSGGWGGGGCGWGTYLSPSGPSIRCASEPILILAKGSRGRGVISGEGRGLLPAFLR